MRGARTRPALAAALIVTVALGVSPAVAAAPVVRPVVLPRDHGAHPGFGVEWWYTAGTLTGAHGRPYFWFATAWTSAMGTIGRVNVVDLRRDRIVLAHEFVAAASPAVGQRRIRAGGFSIGWRPTGRWGRWSVSAGAASGSLALQLQPERA